MKHKIGFVIPRAYQYFFKVSKSVGGGAEKQIYLLAKALSKIDNFDISVCLADFGQDKFFQKDNINFWRIHKLEDNKFTGLIKILKTLKKVNSDVFVFMAANPAIAFIAFYIKNILKKKIVYMMASDVEIKFSSLRMYTNIITASLMQSVYKSADLLIVQNQSQLNIEQKRKNKATILIPNPIELNKDDLNINFNRKSGTIWVGRLDPIKQTEIYLKLAKEFEDTQFNMVAPKSLEHPKYGEIIISQLSNINNIHYKEYVDNKEILKYFNQAKIYVITSSQEGFSNTMMEAMLSGCAVLSLNVNPNGIFDSQENGLCAYGDFNLFTKYFKQLIHDKEFAKQLGKNAQNYIVKNHNIDDIAKQMANKLKALMS